MALCRPHRTRALLVILPVLLALLLPLQHPLPATAAALPDLRLTAVEATRSSVPAGSSLPLEYTVKNTGRKKAGRSLTRFYLSRDDTRSKSDALVGKRWVPRVPAGQVRRRSTELRVPPDTRARRYFVVACTDAKRMVAESRERNNCRATRRKVKVTEPGGPVTFPFDPDPLSVGSTLQTERAVTRTAWSWGPSQITATGTDGTSYTLDIPEGALWNNEEITMTPVASVTGLPLSGGLVAAVQIEPHGLLLQKPATLTIESPNAGRLPRQTGFLFHEGGDDLHLYPLDAPEPGDDKDVVRMSLSHFSTPGVGLATNDDRTLVAGRPPARTQSQMQQAVAQLLSDERVSQLLGNEPDPAVFDQVEAIHNAYFDDVVRAQMAQAESDADLGPAAIAEGLGWARARSLLGDGDNPRIDEVFKRVARIFRHMMDAFWTRCIVDHELAAASWLVGVARQAALLGYDWQDEAADKARRCANFEMRFDSRISGWHNQPGQNQSHQSDYLYHVRSTVEVPWTGTAYGALTYSAFEYFYRIDYDVDACVQPNHYVETHGTGTTPGSLWAAVLARPNPQEVSPKTGTSPPPTVEIRVQLGTSAQGPSQPTETYHTENYSCTPSERDQTRSGWLDNFYRLHNHTSPLVLEVQVGTGDVLVAEAWNRTVAESWGEVHEETTFEVWHKPLS